MKTQPPGLFRSRSRTRTGVTGTYRPWDAGKIPADTSAGLPIRLSARDAFRISAAIRKANGCALCPAPAVTAATWFPTPKASRRLGAPTDKERIVVVGLCAACQALPDVIKRIEEYLLAEAAEALARPEAN